MTTTSASTCSPVEARFRVSGLSLRSNVIWTIFGNAGYAASQWAILIALAKSGSAVTVGQFALALAVTAPVFIAANLQLRSVQAAHVTEQFTFRDFLAVRIVAAGVGLAVVAVVGLSYEWTAWVSILLMGLAKTIESISDIVCGVFQSRERMDLVTRSMLLRGFGSLLAVVVCLPFSGDVSLAIAALLTARIVVLACYDLPLCRRFVSDLRPRFDWRRITSLVKLAWPLGLVTMIGSVNVNIPRYRIESTLGAAELGIFSALSYVLVVAAMITAAVGQSATPRLANALSEGKHGEFRALALRLCLLSAGVGASVVLVAATAGPQLLTVLYGAEYAKHAPTFNLLALASAISLPASIVSYCTTATQSFSVQVPIALATALTTYLASASLIPAQGLAGAPLALVAANALQLVLATTILVKASRKHFNICQS